MVNNGLTNQHPVKGIFVQYRKPGQMERGFFVERQRVNAMLLSLRGNKSYVRLRKRELAKRVFDGDLPVGDRTQIDLTCGIHEQCPSVIGEIGSVSYRPQKPDSI